jgi:hypothetical protein
MNGRPNQTFKTQSAAYDRLLVLGLLTDKQIEEYERQGRYGPERQKAALELQKLRESDKKHREVNKAARTEARKKHQAAVKAMVSDLV